MSTKKKQQEQARKRVRWKKEDDEIKDFRRKAPHMKKYLQGRGCILPFYDYLDSYADEFERIVGVARKEFPSLLGIHEVDDETYFKDKWSQLGYENIQQIFFGIDDKYADYGTAVGKSNLCGSMIAFHDSNQEVRTLVLIRQKVEISAEHREYKYALKIIALFHELGHIHDLERRINFGVEERRLDLIEAEVYAHLYCIEHLARRNLIQSFNMLVDGLQAAIPKGGYIAEVANKVLERLPNYGLVEWQTVLSDPPTREEIERLGPEGFRAITS